jgi:peptidoglycan hydrolase-like protein with peptidoglycan-binding domain
MFKKNVNLLLLSGILVLTMASESSPQNTQSGTFLGRGYISFGTAVSVEDIRKVQIALKNRGYDPGEINGMVSSETEAAIKKFQFANNLPVSGNLDEPTRAALSVHLANRPSS